MAMKKLRKKMIKRIAVPMTLGLGAAGMGVIGAKMSGTTGSTLTASAAALGRTVPIVSTVTGGAMVMDVVKTLPKSKKKKRGKR